jgi:serine/threonine-protein phosphatase 2A activator
VDPSAWSSEPWAPAKKRILCEEDLQKALVSQVCVAVAFTLSLNDAVTGKKLSDECHISGPVQKLLDALTQLQAICDETPPSTQSMRYGNPAYKVWASRMAEAAPELVMNILADDTQEAVIEILPYFLDSFGNAVRIDFGTGHETNFVAFLYCLFALGAFTAEDRQAVVTRVFKQYMQLMHKLQTTYWCAHRPEYIHIVSTRISFVFQ